MASSSEEAPDTATRQSFSLLQSRKFIVPSSKSGDIDTDADDNYDNRKSTICRLAKLCPSMDLILVRIFSSSSSSLVIYRSLSWQKVAGIPLREYSNVGDSAGSSGSDSDSGSLSYCWSPSGQCVAVAQDSSVSLYGVENLITAAGRNGAMSGSNSGSADWTITIVDFNSENVVGGSSSSSSKSVDVIALHWAHVGKNHPTAAAPSMEEEEREISWRYQSHYIDQSTKFLPPSAYYCNDGMEGGGGSMGMSVDAESSVSSRGSLPECRTPLSVLCVSTNDMEHRLYLHGRYPLLTLPKCNNGFVNTTSSASSMKSPLVVASNDLAYWLTATPIANDAASSTTELSTNNSLTLYHTPFLKRDRYALQQIAALHTSITAHLQMIKRSVSIVAGSWQTSLKPLDQKLLPLTNLLRNYGVEVDENVNNEVTGNTSITMTTLSTVMKEYIMMGHVTHSSSIANAMDQFFTGVQMNDQLLQRMERSLLASMGNVESTAIGCLLRPTQALGWQIQELGGLVQFFDTTYDDDADTVGGEETISSKSQLVQELIEASQQMWISTENVITSIVSGRMLVRDFCGWLRHAGSQVKARGTAPNSVQRENAKKRRVSQAILERLVTVLNKSQKDSLLSSSTMGKDQKTQTGLSETLLNLTVTEMLTEATEIPSSTRPQSPSSVRGILYPIPSVCPSVQQAFAATKSLFSNPLSNVPNQICSKDIFLPRTSSSIEKCIIATHSRIGRDSASCSVFWDDDKEEGEEMTHFLPKISYKSNRYANLSPESGLENCRQWFLIAQASQNIIQIFCLPLGWTQKDPDDNDIEDEDIDRDDIPYYLTAKLILPVEGRVLQIGFYGDDGKSSLSSGMDSGSGMEGKQKIGFIYRNSSSSSVTELWTTVYDSLLWQAVPFDSMLLNASQVDSTCCRNILPISLARDYDEEEVLVAHNRIVSENSSTELCELLLPQRGVGGVVTDMNEGNIASLELLDLEEHEGDDDDDDEEEDYEE